MMLNDATFSSPESAFYEYQRKMENQLCQVCHCLAAGFHHGAYVCEACKKFFKRYSTNQLKSNLICKKNCDLDKIGRRKCSFCRYQKCLNVGMKFFGLRSTETNIDISRIPCRVCGGKSSGFHFGSLTCEGCKGFFRRAEPLKDKLECISGRFNCNIDSSHKMPCKWCRYHRCMEVGMSKIGSRIGRQPNAVKHHCALEIISHQISSFSPRTNLDARSNEFESSNSESNIDETHKSLTISIPSTPVIRDLYITISMFSDQHSNILFAKLMEALDVLQKPITEAETLCQMTRYPILRSQSLLEVWNSMMRHFNVHTCILVYFAKKIPGFNNFTLSDKRTMVQDAMYSIMLLNLARSYQENKVDEFFNYFDFTKDEYEVILFHFPEMKRILEHVIDISRLIYKVKINKVQVGLLCIIELYKNYINMESFNAIRTMHKKILRLFWLSILNELDNESFVNFTKSSLPRVSILLRTLDCPEDLISHILLKIPKSLEIEICEKLHIIFKVIGEKLQEFNLEHQSIIDQLKKYKPELPYPELYMEMFQLTSY